MEDPIEYIHRHQKCIVTQREITSDAGSYVRALRAALRESPDVILLGEMRDYETIEVAMTAAETGQLLFSTLHTTGAANTIDRIIDVFPANAQQQVRVQLSMVLQAVICQQLVPTLDGALVPDVYKRQGPDGIADAALHHRLRPAAKALPNWRGVRLALSRLLHRRALLGLRPVSRGGRPLSPGGGGGHRPPGLPPQPRGAPQKGAEVHPRVGPKQGGPGKATSLFPGRFSVTSRSGRR